MSHKGDKKTMGNYSSGNREVDMIGQMNFTGNIIPPIWCKRICFANGKPNLNAIIILSDIVYWYRPSEVRDENTGAIVRYEKKFKADLLQRSYQCYADQFGISKRQAKDGNNLNQYAKKANESGTVRQEDVDQLKIQMEEIWEALREIYHQLAKIP